ncbi:tol-pal system-associated acyl-CoA thioesterase [Aliiroseovarius marinus]|uniref:tol-pal system-associated acyl-CoA thioesterase n=1 Tax=Aliiroseovarius marinus TaxID=2500159 RepID=UPI0024901E7B|nr:tol-pal system-associated acyl-CoA thioesterase [Aliiroseovarius marinus]
MHQFPIRVYYEDTDMAGIVYYANYLRYIERARSDWVREIGIDQNAMREEGLVFAVRRVEAVYIAPAKFDDELQVETSVEQVTAARLVLAQLVKRGEQPLFQAVVTIVCVADTGAPARLPANIRRLVH